MKPLALAFLLACPALAAAPSPSTVPVVSTSVVQPLTPPPGSLDSAAIRLAAGDAAGSLSDAETALAQGGGADAYAARADAERALGHPFAEVLADYTAAAKLDPRYIAKRDGLLAQQESEQNPNKKHSGGKGLNGVPIAGILAVASIGSLCLGIAVVMLKARNSAIDAPDDEAVKAGGKTDVAAEKPTPADEERTPKKEPPKA